ncbi:protein SHOOT GRAVITROPISM 5 [Artemisia annua]|uniref:Protein SHOOT GRAVITROPISM 5 n=1 Tax=Artemisia annua TaxID=35608 RepID=A0A2U1LJ33_ARTAN|nr:protein SHOOT GRAVITROPISM 5 [Artemisia annua]
MENNHKELQLLPIPYTPPSYSRASQWPSNNTGSTAPCPTLDLQLSISLQPIKPPLRADTMTWQAAIERAYIERIMEMTRREIDMAQMEFARARNMWEMAREEVERAEKMKERAICRVESCMEITCHACRKKFRP